MQIKITHQHYSVEHEALGWKTTFKNGLLPEQIIVEDLFQFSSESTPKSPNI